MSEGIPEVTHFDYNQLPQVTRKEASFLVDYKSFLRRTGFTDHLGQSLSEMLSQLVNLSFEFCEEKVTTFSGVNETVGRMSGDSVYVVAGLLPFDEKIIIELDPLISFMLVDRLLGGNGELPTKLRPLTDIEQGVLSYLLMKIFSHIFRQSSEAQVHFRLEFVSSSLEEASGFVSRHASRDYPVVRVDLRVTIGTCSGYLRVVLPSPVLNYGLQEGMSSETSADKSRKVSGETLSLSHLGFIPVECQVEVGRTTLAAGEIQSIEPGDVVLLDQTNVHVAQGNLTGHFLVRIGCGLSGGFRSRLLSESTDTTSFFQVEGVEYQ